MAKKEEAPVGEPKKKIRIKKVDTGEARENYTVINVTDDNKIRIVTRAMHVRGFGVQVETIVYNNGVPVSVATNFVSGLKVKTKKQWKFLVIDKGPKVKKDKAVK